MGNMRFKVGDRIRIKSIDWYNENKNETDDIECSNNIWFYREMSKFCGKIMTISHVRVDHYTMVEDLVRYWTDEMIEGLVEEETKPKDMGEVSDGYHTFNELYEYRMLYNAALFNEFAKQGLYDVHKSRKHSDGEYPFGDSNWFIVMAELPTGQISNHYELKDWNKFQIPEKPLANKWDGHSPKDVAERLTGFTNPKKEYPKTYKECCEIVNANPYIRLVYNLSDGQKYSYDEDNLRLYESIRKLLVCRDAYWKIAGEEMELGIPWKHDWRDEDETKWVIFNLQNKKKLATRDVVNAILSFPTEGMRDAFYENFKELIEICKELL